MFNLGLSEIILISIIALIFIGPKQLPEIARAIGKALNELKRASEDLTSSFTNPKNYTSNNYDLKSEEPAPPPLAPHDAQGLLSSKESSIPEESKKKEDSSS